MRCHPELFLFCAVKIKHTMKLRPHLLPVMLPLIVLLSMLLPGCKSANGQNPPLPNIVLIFADDLGYGDLGSYGALDYETPHLDQLASEGMRFTNFMSAQAVCSASRAGLLTGCYPNRIGISGALFPASKNGIAESEMTMAELLKQKDYATAIFGKWHLGHHRQFLPLQNGFDEYLGIPYSNDMWPVDFDGIPVDSTHRKTRYPPLPLIDGNEKAREIWTLEDQGMLTTWYTGRAVSFIEKNKDKPFFLYLPHSMPHVPIAASSKFKGKSKQGTYGDVVMEIDWSVGEILAALDRLGLRDNTLVIFTSDNGPWLNFGNHAGSTGGLREGKGTSFEGGQREPCVMRWPGVIPAGKVCNELASTIDIFPTVAAVTGTSPPDHKIDGVNILELMKGNFEARPRREFLYYYHNNHLEAVRKDNWKLVLPHDHRSYEGVLPGNDGHPGPYRRAHTELALYDLRRDPGEEYDVQELYPDIVNELQQIAGNARQDLGDALTEREGANRRDCGRVK